MVWGLRVYCGVDGGVLRTPEDPVHAERREREQERDGRGRACGRSQRRPGDLTEGLPGRRAERPSRLHGATVEALPEPADGPNDDGVVEEGVGDEDRPHRLVEVDADRRSEEHTSALQSLMRI